jgi:amidase
MQISPEQSGAFVERFSLEPTREGPLKGLRFAVKDIIDVAGRTTGCGNPTWLATHPPATISAVCVEQLLAAGAKCEGKTITDELAFSIIGENFFYGTPLNPAAPQCVPGGSSSGSASAVACGIVDLALGTDTGGSVRIPASNCGIWGWRPTHGMISVAGVMPLSPSFDTVGVLAVNCDVLRRAASVLLSTGSSEPAVPTRIFLLSEFFALADNEVREALRSAVELLRRVFGEDVREVSLGKFCDDAEAGQPATWIQTYRDLFGAEVGSTLGNWVAAVRPELGPAAAKGFEFAGRVDRTRINEAVARRERYFQKLRSAMGSRDLLCLPTTPAIAPRRGTSDHDRSGDYYSRTGSYMALAGVGRLPQVSMPLARVGSVPLGLSLIGQQYEDLFLLNIASEIAQKCSRG